MSELNLNLSDYKSSGVYFVEIDNSISTGSINSAIRLAVGYNEQGPFNRPIYLSSTADCDELLGDIDLRLERRGCYTNRNIRTMVPTAPVYALNLLPVDTSNNSNDKSGFCALSFDVQHPNTEGKIPFYQMYDRSKFWIADSSTMMHNVAAAIANDSSTVKADTLHGPLFAVGNSNVKDISLIIRKAEGITGYNVTFLDWYGSKDAIPYSWINPYDYVSDYFIQVIAVNGNYTNYGTYSKDSSWKSYFTANGLKKDSLNKFLRLDAVSVIGNWVGCIIPDFYDKQGKCKSIDYQINRLSEKTGLLFGVNTDALDTLCLDYDTSSGKSTFFLDINGNGENDLDSEEAHYIFDLLGANIENDSSLCNFLSYNLDEVDPDNLVYTVRAKVRTEDVDKTKFLINVNDNKSVENTDSSTKTYEMPKVGDFVKASNGTLTKIIKKKVIKDASLGDGTFYEFTTLVPFKQGDEAITTQYAVYNDPEIEDSTETTEEEPAYQNYMVLDNSDDSQNTEYSKTISIEIHRTIESVYSTLHFIELPGLNITNKLRPGYDKNGNMNVEAGIEKIYKMLEDDGIKRGLLNNDIIDFRYIVDTLGGGLGDYTSTERGDDSDGVYYNGKRYLSLLAKEKGRCTALVNLPSMSDFASSTTPIFCDSYNVDLDSKPSFKVEYIAQGGNMDQAYDSYCGEYELPVDSEEGAKYTAFFAPYLKYYQGSKTVLIPPAADVCNVFMSKYLGGDPYATIANRNGILNNSNIAGVEYNFDKSDRDALEPFGVNPIIQRGNTIMIYGDRTAYQTVNSDFNYLHVRELLNTIEVRCKEILDDYPFTQNNANTRAEIVKRLTPIFTSMKESGALAKYEIQMDELNNTQDIIDEKFGIVDIGVWVTPNMEKIVTRITVNRGSEA